MKKKISWKSSCTLLGVVVILAALASPHYMWTLERARAGAATALLTQLSVAEHQYFMKENTYTEDWRQLDALLPPAAQLPGVLAPAGAPGSVRVFETDVAHGGFLMRVLLENSGASGRMSAEKQNGMIRYELSEKVPYPSFVCEGRNALGRWFCNKFAAYIDEFMLKPRPADESEAAATEPAEQEVRK